jgi:cyclophilin family peptidyl-prolyl cis-trans isomerase
MWSWARRRNRKRSLTIVAPAAAQALEARALLAGNVVASLNGNHLTVLGDTADNAIEVSVFNNEVHLRGVNNTTVNGGTGIFVVATASDTIAGNVLISLGAGNDTVTFNRAVRVDGHVSFLGSTGNDTFNAANVTFLRNIALLGHDGNDTFSLQDSTVSGELRIHGHRGNDLISLTDLTQTRLLTVVTGGGNDGVSLNNVTVNGGFGIGTGRGDDDIAVRNSRITGVARIGTHADEDVVVLDDNTFNSPVSIVTGRNNDSVGVRDTNTFNSSLYVMAGDSRRDGGTAGDAVEIAAGNVFNQGRRIRSEEVLTVSPAAANRIDAANTGLMARAAAADNAAGSNSLTATASSTQSESSTGGVLITRVPEVTITGATTPGATVNVDSDNDGSFDDGTAVADANGSYSVNVVATRRDLYTSDATTNDQLTGLQTIRLRSTATNVPAADASVIVDFVQNTVVRFASNLGTYEVELFDSQAPLAVANFLGYSDRYDNSIIHRSVDNFVIQGGGFTINDGVIDNVPTDAPITNEFNSARTNIRGTLSMALVGGDVNSGTSQWFVNLVNNPSLDTTTTRHTVFGRVIGNGMTVVDAIAAVNQVDLSSQTGVSALNELPQRQTFTEFTRTITGTVSTTANSTTITGVGTKFTEELVSALGNPGGSRSRIRINGQAFNVVSITDDTTLTVSAAPTTSVSGQAAQTDQFVDDNFVRFTSIAEIL